MTARQQSRGSDSQTRGITHYNPRMKKVSAGGGWPAIWYTLRKGRQAGGLLRTYRALRSKNACKTCALGMGGQRGGMVNEKGQFPEVCKKSIQAMAADMQGAIRGNFFDDMSLDKLSAMTPRELEAAGRITQPLIAGPLDSHYKQISWDEALDRLAKKMHAISPDESFFYFSGRSSNEAGFLLQLLARAWGTNNVNNCSYYCHQASGVGLSSITGSGTATVVLDDIDKCDLVILIGANPSSNHPRLMRSLMDLKRRGGKVIVINPLREVGLERFKVPSDVRSLFFGTKIADLYLQPNIGGDIALLQLIARRILERESVDDTFVHDACDDWNAFQDHLRSLDETALLRAAGVDQSLVDQAAGMYEQSDATIFCWAMGLTHHQHGVENVQMLGNLAMMRGMLGSPGRGLLPLRGHSNVQGMGSMGVTPALKEAVFDKLQTTFSMQLPTTPGLDTLDCMHGASDGSLKLGICLGGNLFGSNPDADFARAAMRELDTVTYLSTTLNTGHAHGRGRETIILPVLARDEEPQPTTQESMFNFVRISDGGTPRHHGPRAEVEVIADLAERLFENPREPIDWASMRQYGNIRSAIANIIPGYESISEVDTTKCEFHINGRTFHTPTFATDTGRAQFHLVDTPAVPAVAENQLRLMTVRSEGQFNTVVYEEHDLYRGMDRRDVIMMHPDDITRMELRTDDHVTVRSECGALGHILVRKGNISPGNAVMYYPEANVLVPRAADAKSKTPAFKNVLVTIEAQQAAPVC